MKKRIMSLLLCIVMVLSVAPLYAYAAGGTDGYVSIKAEKETLAAGESTDVIFTVHATGDPLGAINFTVNLPAGLTYVSHEVLVSPSDYMMSGYDQTTGLFGCGVTTAGKNGTFDVLKLTVKAKDSSAGNNPIDITMGGMYKVDGSTEMDFGTSYSTTITISAVLTGTQNITGVTAPAKGATPVNTVTPPTGVLADISWYKDGEDTPLSGNFEGETVYTAKINVKPVSGYAFADDIAFTVDGSSDGWIPTKQGDGSYILTKTFPPTVGKTTQVISVSDVTATYGGTGATVVASITTGDGTLSYSVKPGCEAYIGVDPSTGVLTIKKAGTAYVIVTAAETTDYARTEKEVKVTIGKKSITPTVTVTGSYTYNDGNPITPAFTVEDSGTGLAATDYIAEFTNNINAGTGTITVKEAANGNYTFAQVQQTFTIGQKSHGNETASGSARYGAEGTVDLSSYIAPGGTATYASKTDSDSVLAEDPSLVGNVLKFKFADNSSNVGKNATATINVTSANYTNYAITVTLTVTDKVTPTVTAPTAKALTYNGAEQVLINAGSTTGGELQYSLTSGSGYSTELPKAKDADSYNVYYKVVGDAEYADVAENHITVIINKKAATVAPKSFTITKGDAIPTFELTYTGLVSGDTLIPSTAPIFTCFESDGSTPVSTSTQAGTYTITWTNESTITFTGVDNYDLTKTATATLTISNPSSGGGGGGGGVTTYAITVEDAKNGTITVSPKSASKGSTVTITVKPDKGYELDTLKVLDSKNQTIKLTEKDGKFTFTMPAGKVTVKGSFKAEAPVVEHPFTDIPEGSYYEDAVIWAVDKGVTAGTSATTFAPDGICTRAQAVTFLWRAAGSPEPKTSTMPFTDVKAGSYYYDAVLWAVEQGITAGTSATTFAPDLNCSRGQIATFLWRSAKSPAAGAANPFTDVKADAYYADAVLWAVKEGVTNGSSATTFSPDVDCSRAQIVTFIYRHMTK